VDRSGVEQPLPVAPAPYAYPRLSHRGDRLAVAIPNDIRSSAGADLWVIDLERFAPTRITFGGENRFFPTWTGDDSRLTHADGSGTRNALLWTRADGAGRPDTLIALERRAFPTSWSSDARTLACHQGGAPSPEPRDLCILELDGPGATARLFLTTPFEDRAPVFSPDGDWLAYVSNKSGRDQVYVVPYPGPGTETTVSTTGGREPVWSRDGTELFYRSDEDVRMMVVDVELRGGFRGGVPRPLFADVYERDGSGGGLGGVANYDVSPDGSRLLMVRGDADSDYSVTVTLNWADELARLLPE
jgi:Tol biopolymer transport system component